MDSQLFFYANVVLGLLFLFWFLSSRKGRGLSPNRLNLRQASAQVPQIEKNGAPSRQEHESSVKKDSSNLQDQKENWGEGWRDRWKDRRRGGAADSSADPSTDSREVKTDPQIKTLTAVFIYNGHDWEAYEVLGLPAGANLRLVTERYQQLLKTSSAGECEFFEAAYQAILKKF